MFGLMQATRVSLEHDGAAIEDLSWLQKVKDVPHIKLAKFDAVLKGISIAFIWKSTMLHLFTNSACVHKWITGTLTRKARVHPKVTGEMLIKQCTQNYVCCINKQSTLRPFNVHLSLKIFTWI